MAFTDGPVLDDLLSTDSLPAGSCSSLTGPTFNASRCQVISVLRKVLSTLSLFGCLFILIFMYLFRRYRLFVHRLILYLVISTTIYSINSIISTERPPNGWCSFQALVRQFSLWATLLWEAVIIFNLFVNAVKQIETARFERYYHILVWAVAILISFIPLFAGSYGLAGAWCWIETPMLRLVLYHIPNLIILSIMFVCYGVAVCFLYRKDMWGTSIEDERLFQMMKDQVRPLIVYPIIFLVLSIFPVINRTQNVIADHPVFWLTLLHTMSYPTRGLALAIVYAMDPETRSKLSAGHIEAAIYRARNKTVKGEYKVGSKVVKSIESKVDVDNTQNMGDESPVHVS